MLLFPIQVQYEFIHHALSELVVCGETEVTASSLKTFTKGLKVGDGITSSEKHYQVCVVSHKLTCKDIRDSVDSLCRDGHRNDTPINPYRMAQNSIVKSPLGTYMYSTSDSVSINTLIHSYNDF